MQSRRRIQYEPDKGFWTSYSDVIAGLLLMFILLLATTSSRFHSETKRLTEELQSRRDETKSLTEELQNRSVETKRLTEELQSGNRGREELERKTELFSNTEKRGECIRGAVMIAIKEMLEGRLEKQRLDSSLVSMDDGNVYLVFDDLVRFSIGSSSLPSAEAKKAALNRIMDAQAAFYAVPLADRIVDKVQIVGRTDLVGGDLFNMVLSMKRSSEVLSLLEHACMGLNCVMGGGYTDNDPDSRFTQKLTVQGLGRRGAKMRNLGSNGTNTATADNPDFRRVELHFIGKSTLNVNEEFNRSTAVDGSQSTKAVDECIKRFPVLTMKSNPV